MLNVSKNLRKIYASMAELADALDLGSSGRPWGFKSLCSHHGKPKPNFWFRFFVYVDKGTRTGRNRKPIKKLFALWLAIKGGHPPFTTPA